MRLGPAEVTSAGEEAERVDAASETCTEQQRFTATPRGEGGGGQGEGGGGGSQCTFEETQNAAGGRKRH